VSDRADLQTEANQTTQEVNSVASNTQFNGVKLLDASTPALAVQTGAGEGDTRALSLPASGTGSLGLSQIDLSSSASAAASESSADAAISTIATGQAKLGSQTVALQFAEKNSENESNNLTAAASNIDDADITQTSTNDANDKTGSRIQADLQVQAHLAASSVLGLFPS
jgi:flagellin